MGPDMRVVRERSATGNRLMCYEDGVKHRREVVSDGFLHRCLGCESLNTRLLLMECVWSSPECWEIAVRCEDCGRERHEICTKAAQQALVRHQEYAKKELETALMKAWVERFVYALKCGYILPVDF